MNERNNWKREIFSFTKSEIRGLTVLIIIIIGLTVYRIYLKDRPESDFFLEKTTSAFNDTIFKKTIFGVDTVAHTKTDRVAAKKPFSPRSFDPNHVTLQELLDMGFDRFPADNLLKYRENGGSFHRPSDLLRIYGIDSDFYSRIRDYIIISDNTMVKSPITSFHRKSARYDLNKIDSSDLLRFKGIGPVLASRIVKYRELLGGFISVNQLYEVYGLPDSVIAQIIPDFSVDTTAIKKLNLNNSDFSELTRHPYLNAYQAKAILAFRKHSGNFKEINQLLDYYLLPDKVYLKVAPYLTLR